MNAITQKLRDTVAPDTRHLHDSVMHALRKEVGESAGTQLRCLGRQRDTITYLTDGRELRYPDGILVKLPASLEREARWNPIEEATNLKRLCKLGPSGADYRYLEPLCVSSAPKFIALPFVKGRTLRQLMGASLGGRRQAVVACYQTGQWLGSLYDRSPVLGCSGDTVSKTEALAEIIERLESSFGLRMANLKRHLPLLLEHYFTCMAGNPLHRHGDLNPDNVLVGADGRICLIDPEPIRTGLFGDYTHFLQSLIVTYNRPSSKLTGNCMRAPRHSFIQGFQSRYRRHDSVPYAHVITVIEKLSFFARQRTPVGDLMHPRKLIYSYDRWQLLRHWLNWLAATPRERNQLPDHFTRF